MALVRPPLAWSPWTPPSSPTSVGGWPTGCVPCPTYGSPDRSRRLADLAAGVERRAEPSAPPPRPVPGVPDFAVGDVVAVTGFDLVAAAETLPAQTQVWRDGERTELAATVADGAAACRALRLAL